MERTCGHCDRPSSSLLRIVLIGEIVRADDATLYALAEVFQTLGLLDVSEEEDTYIPDKPTMRSPRPGALQGMLRLVK